MSLTKLTDKEIEALNFFRYGADHVDRSKKKKKKKKVQMSSY